MVFVLPFAASLLIDSFITLLTVNRLTLFNTLRTEI